MYSRDSSNVPKLELLTKVVGEIAGLLPRSQGSRLLVSGSVLEMSLL